MKDYIQSDLDYVQKVLDYTKCYLLQANDF